MSMFKRIFLFLLINILVVLTLSAICNFLQIQPLLTSYGIDAKALMFFCLIWGMGGAFISLFLSKHMIKWMMNINIIDAHNSSSKEKILLSYVTELATNANVKMPEVGVYESSDVNAFATGMSKNKSLIAVSTGLLERMSSQEVKAVLGHEMTHISNGDMVTMTLLQGIVNAFVMFLARILAFVISGLGKNKENNSGGYMTYYFTTMFLEIIFMILGSIPLAFFSRIREYRADKGSAQLVGKEYMISALQTLKEIQEEKEIKSQEEETLTPAPAPALNTLKISSSKKTLISLFATHPSLEDRIERLKNLVL